MVEHFILTMRPEQLHGFGQLVEGNFSMMIGFEDLVTCNNFVTNFELV